ncbi:hypothetical protein OWZ45_004012 [Salmonella enterica]|nr:hypothetical protein [Salmonella enterica subsp. diarizonae]EKE8135590.1 hypothetical protein [Salmonella enterica]
MSDLLHFALIKSIEPIIYVVGEWVYKGEKLNGSDLCKSIDGNNPDITSFLGIKPDKTKTDFCTIAILEEEIKNKNQKRKPSLFISIEGFMWFYSFNLHTFYSDLNIYNEADISDVIMLPYSEPENDDNNEDNKNDESYHKEDSVFSFVEKTISTNDLYITHKEFELLKNGGREGHSRNINMDINKRPSSPHPKTSNAQARVIKALIEAIGGKHAVNHPRNAVDNLNSELNKALDRAGVEIPVTGVTIEKWLKGID